MGVCGSFGGNDWFADLVELLGYVRWMMLYKDQALVLGWSKVDDWLTSACQNEGRPYLYAHLMINADLFQHWLTPVIFIDLSRLPQFLSLRKQECINLQSWSLQVSYIYKTHHLRHQMLKVDKKPPLKNDSDEKNQSETNQEQRREEDLQKVKPKTRLREYDTYEIDHQTLPYIFRFNYAALQRLKIKRSPQVPQLAVDIFQYLKDKLVVRRYSEGGKYPNRMKYQEKVKFLMRAFDHRRPPPPSNTPQNTPKAREKFNRQKQLEFFTRPEVRQHFLAEIQHALVKKRAQNERRIRDMEDCIEVALEFNANDPEKAEKVFEHRIKRKQLPWTDNMFQDIEEFSKQLYARFSAENIEFQRQAIKDHNATKQQRKEESEGGGEGEEGGSGLDEDEVQGQGVRSLKFEQKPAKQEQRHLQ